jgi:hypothetical protein
MIGAHLDPAELAVLVEDWVDVSELIDPEPDFVAPASVRRPTLFGGLGAPPGCPAGNRALVAAGLGPRPTSGRY